MRITLITAPRFGAVGWDWTLTCTDNDGTSLTVNSDLFPDEDTAAADARKMLRAATDGDLKLTVERPEDQGGPFTVAKLPILSP